MYINSIAEFQYEIRTSKCSYKCSEQQKQQNKASNTLRFIFSKYYPSNNWCYSELTEDWHKSIDKITKSELHKIRALIKEN